MNSITPLPGTRPLTWTGDLSQRMVAGLYAYFDRLMAASAGHRAGRWGRDLSSLPAYTDSVQLNRERFGRLIGLVDQRLPAEMLQSYPAGQPFQTVETGRYSIQSVSWAVLEGVNGEGLLLTPRDPVRGRVVALPDADQTPEQLVGLVPGIAPVSQFARRLAENGFQVVVPALINRESTFSCSPALGKTNQTHREWIYRQAFEMGRHVIGFEVQKVLAAIDWFQEQDPAGRVGVAGYGEGGLIAFYAAAIDLRIRAALVSGYFGPRENVWQEPIERNIWGLLAEFGDAEIASLIAPRALVVEYTCEPEVCYSPPLDMYGEAGIVAAPGKLVTPGFDQVLAEFERIDQLVGTQMQLRYLCSGPGGTPLPCGSIEALNRFTARLGIMGMMELSDQLPEQHLAIDPSRRQKRQVRQLEKFLQELVRDSDAVRRRFFFDRVHIQSMDRFLETARSLRQTCWEEVIGRLEDPLSEMAPRSRLIFDQEKWVGYEVVLDVWENVFAWGILCIPKDLKPGEKRPVVVCQHGYEGEPRDTIEDTEDGLRYYRRFTARLAERGFITFAPHNPYRGAYRYKQLQRKANPLKASLGSVIIGQHSQILRWLGSLPFVQPDQIAFYGLSYGGWTAVRIPPILEGYCLSICSANFNDWIRKVTSLSFNNSYMGDASFEMCEWNAGNTFSNAEMAFLMAPRPFMVERGMHDIVAPDSWVASEYAKVRWLYTQLGIPDQTEIEFFNGEHCINGQGTFEFLHRHLHWPRPESRGAP